MRRASAHGIGEVSLMSGAALSDAVGEAHLCTHEGAWLTLFMYLQMGSSAHLHSQAAVGSFERK